jgi:hypothetical protein
VTRPAVKAGLPGPGQDRFPEQARELGRDQGLVPGALVVLRHTSVDSKGATRETYNGEAAIRGRIDPVGRTGSGGTMGDVLNESSSHLVTFDATVAISAADRLRIGGRDWLITAVREVTDPLVRRVEVKGA